MPLITPEDACKETAATVPFGVCMREQEARGVRSPEVESHCAAAFPKDVELNNECRKFCWARTDDVASCTLEVTTLIYSRKEFENGHREHQIAVGLALTVVLAIVSLVVVKRTRTVFSFRRIFDRRAGHSGQASVDDHKQIAASAATTGSSSAHGPSPSMVVLLNIGRVLMWLWMISGAGHLLLGADVAGAIQQPFFMFAYMLQIIVAFVLLVLMTRAVRRRRLTTPDPHR